MAFLKTLLGCFGANSLIQKEKSTEEGESSSGFESAPTPTGKLEHDSNTASPPAVATKEYVLKRDWQGSSRLNLQFFLWKNLLKFNIHPEIPEPCPGMRIADVATGTGLWLADMAANLPPTVRFDGFDISLEQAPASGFHHPNIQMHRWDMFQDPPAKYMGQFDIVHVRLVTLVIKNNDPIPLVRNLRKLLKPGGYLQWDEIDTLGCYIHSKDPDMPTPALENLFKTFKIPKSSRGRDDWKALLPTTLNNSGFRDSKLYVYQYDPTMARFWHDMYMQSWEEFASMIFGSTEHAQDALALAQAEVHRGAAVMFPKFVWIAKAE